MATPLSNFIRKLLLAKNFGLGLVEAILVIGMIGIFLSIVVPALQTFNQSQTIKTAAVNLKSNLRQAQDNAYSGRKEDVGGACTTGTSLIGWYANFDFLTNTGYKIRGVCSDTYEFSGKNVNFPSGVVIVAIERILPLPVTNTSSLFTLFRSARNDTGFYSSICLPACPGTEISGSVYKITLGLSSARHYIYIKSTGEIYDSKN